MNPEVGLLTDIVFWVISIGAIVGALTTVGIRNIFRSAITLVGTMLLLAVNFFLLGADFIGAVQILVNVGAVAIILIFGITLLGNLREGVGVARRLTVSLSIVSLVFMGLAVILIFTTSTTAVGGPSRPSAELIGDLLIGNYLGVFEIVGILIAASIVASIVLMRSALNTAPATEENSE